MIMNFHEIINGIKCRFEQSFGIVLTAAAVSATFVSCQKDFLFISVKDGAPVMFSTVSGRAANSETKAVYSGTVSGGEEDIYWQEGDLVRIYCAQVSEPDTKYADYKVSSAENKKATIELNANNEIGLRWNANVSADHSFYAVYPSPYASGICTDITGNTITGILPQSQNTKSDALTGSNGKYVLAPDLKWQLMTAGPATYKFSTFPALGSVFLYFTPVTTAIQFTLTNHTRNALNIKSVSLISASAMLNGNFTYTIAGTPSCSFSGTASDSNKKVDIVFEDTVKLAYDEDIDKCGKLTFTFFALPISDLNDLTFRLVKDDDSTMSLRLCYKDDTGVVFKKSEKTFVKCNVEPTIIQIDSVSTLSLADWVPEKYQPEEEAFPVEFK